MASPPSAPNKSPDVQADVQSEAVASSTSNTQPETQNEPAGPTLTPDVQPDLQSDEVTVTFVNNSANDVEVFWVDGDGGEQKYLDITPGDSFDQGTFPTHVWRVRDLDGNLLLEYTANENASQMVDILDESISSQNGASDLQASYTLDMDTVLDAWDVFMPTGVDNQVSAGVDGGSLYVQLSEYENKLPRFYLVNSDFDYSNVRVEVSTTKLRE